MKTYIKKPFICLGRAPLRSRVLPALLAGLGLMLTLPATMQAQLTFTTNNGAITITGYNTAAGLDVVIPAMTNGYPVSSIGDGAFSYTSITNVTIPNSVTSIGIDAFYQCSLTSVTIPNSLTSIGEFAFASCTSLTNVTIPNSVTSIENSAFGGCTSLTNVTIPNSVTSIVEYAFYGCTNLTNVTIPNSVTSIGDFAFYQCGLTSVTIPKSVTSIGVRAFAGHSLTNINVDAANPALSSLGGVLFNKAQTTLLDFPGALGESYTIPNSVTIIGDFAFYECSGLTSVTIPNSVTTIGNSAFYGCGMSSVSIPNRVTSIGRGAFYNCSGLTSVTIPDSVTSIGSYAFGYCFSLTTAYFHGNAPPDDGTVFADSPADPTTVYYLAGTTGWGAWFRGRPAVLWDPQANTFGFTGGQFGFNLTGPANAVIAVEACTNLSHPVWLPVSTNTLSGLGMSTFSDPQSSGHPVRFYRFRSP